METIKARLKAMDEWLKAHRWTRIARSAVLGFLEHQALQNADAVVVLWSEASIQSAWVQDEAAEGRDSGRLVPVIIGEVLGREIRFVEIGHGACAQVAFGEADAQVAA